jgi:predicted nucleotidyltransferase component of viral defense system
MITKGLLGRHCGGSLRFRDGALIDVAQDHALHILHVAGLFDLGLVFKGGTALRKFRLGTRGRFSTDLDLAVNEAGLADLVFETLNGARHGDFEFTVDQTVPGRRARLDITSSLGSPTIQLASILRIDCRGCQPNIWTLFPCRFIDFTILVS